jgi:adenine deaminase
MLELNDDRETLIDVALGKIQPDLIIKNGKLVNVHTSEIYATDVFIKGKRIAAVGEFNQYPDEKTHVIDARGRYLVPGLIDTHMHIGASHLTITQLARSLVAHGTTAIVSDFYEIYGVSGIRGVKFLLEEASKTPLKILYVVPALLLGFEKLGTFGVDINVEEMKEMLKWSETIGLNEPPPSKVLGRVKEVLDLIRLLREERKVFSGHACETFGRELNAYVAYGGYSDHECTTPDEALMKARLGMRILIREGSASPDLERVVKVLSEHKTNSRHFMFCTDEITPVDLARYGHIDYKIRKTISQGVDPITAIQMATINAAEYFKVENEMGSIVPGKIADILLVDDLQSFKVFAVVADGKLVAKEGRFLAEAKIVTYPGFLKKGVQLKRPIQPEDFKIKTQPDKKEVTVRVIGVEDGTLLKKALTAKLRIENCCVLPDVERDILQISAIERNRASGKMAHAFVSGFNIKEGAIASSYSLVYQNLVVLGANYNDMCVAVNRLADIKGGVTVVRNGKVTAEVQLPIAGFLSDKPLEEVAEKFENVHKAIRELGCNFKAPILTLAFVTVNSIPAYGITDMGLTDVDKQEIVSPIME